MAVLLGISTLGTALYPVLSRKGQPVPGAYITLGSLLLVPGFGVFLIPSLMLAAVWMFAAILLLATLFLGREGCLRFTIAIICLEVVGIILMQDVSPVLFVPLTEAVNLIIMLLSGLILPPIVALVICRNVAEQEKHFCQSKRARWEIEQRVTAERAQQQLQQANQKLDRRALQLQAAAEVSRATGSILDSDELIRQVVELTRERFGLYYVGLYLVDFAHEAGRWAVLRAGTGKAGRKMMATAD